MEQAQKAGQCWPFSEKQESSEVLGNYVPTHYPEELDMWNFISKLPLAIKNHFMPVKTHHCSFMYSTTVCTVQECYFTEQHYITNMTSFIIHEVSGYDEWIHVSVTLKCAVKTVLF